MERMKELYEKVAGDSMLQAKFTEVMKEAEEARAMMEAKFATFAKEAKEAKKAMQAKLTAFAKEAGCELNLEEALEYYKILLVQREDALSEAGRDMAAGGKIRGKLA